MVPSGHQLFFLWQCTKMGEQTPVWAATTATITVCVKCEEMTHVLIKKPESGRSPTVGGSYSWVAGLAA